MKKSKTLSIFLSVVIALFILSFAIYFVIACRPFYYWHISLYDLVNETGYDYQTIKVAYDEMLNFCLGFSKEFSTGALAFSTDGMNHFVDCKVLFDLDLIILLISSTILITYFILHKKKVIEAYRFHNHDYTYYGTVGMFTAIITVGLLCMSDFDKAFQVFHQIFFPGKNNWLFNPYTDQIINVLPQEYFRNCGIFIALIVIGLSLFFIIKDRKQYLGLQNKKEK